MLVYILNYLFILVWGCLKNYRYTICFIGLQLFAILAFRSDSLGVDLDNYAWEYSYIQSFSFKEMLFSLRPFSNAQMLAGSESGYVLLNWLLGYLGLSFHGFLVVHAVACVGSLSLFIAKYSRIPWLSFAIVVSLGMYGMMFCILRQSLAVAILYFSISFIVQREFLKFLGLVFLASQFHVVAWLFLPLYWLSPLIVDYKRFLAVICISVFICISTTFIYKYFFSTIFTLFGKVYILEESFAYNNMFVFLSLLCGMIFFFYGKRIENDKVETTLLWGTLLSIPVQALSFLIPIFSRAAIGIFLPMSSILISNMIAKEEKNKSILFFSFLCYLAFFFYFVLLFNSSGLQINPYRSILE